MSADRKELDLVIRAMLQGGNTLDGVAKSIEKIDKALQSQAEAAKRGEASIDELKGTLTQLEQVQRQLGSLNTLTSKYKQIAKDIENTDKAISSSIKKWTELDDKIKSSGSATEAQAARLTRLSDSIKNQEGKLTAYKASQTELAGVMAKLGVDTNTLSDATRRNLSAQAEAGAVYQRTQIAIAGYAESVRKARVAEKQLADQMEFDRKRAQNLAAFNNPGKSAAQSAQVFIDAFSAQEAADQQTKLTDALRRAAEESIAAAKGYKTLGVAAKDLGSNSSGLRAVIEGILDPARRARSTLQGVEAEIQKVADVARTAKGPLDDYRGNLNALVAAQRSITDKSDLVARWIEQQAALKAAGDEYLKAKSKVLDLVNALGQATSADEKLRESLSKAQATLAATRRELQGQVVATRQIRDSMREAGLTTGSLANVQSRLTLSAQSSVSAMTQLNEAHRKYGDATERAARGSDLFTSSGRTTLSLLQRWRGEVLSLVSAYGGIYGAINGVKEVMDAVNTRNAIASQTMILVGNDQKAISAEWDYMMGQADRLGISIESLAGSYLKFAISAKMAGATKQETRYIFETFAEVGRAAHLSTDDINGVMRALEQVMSKKQIMKEELSQQLGDRIFGIFGVAQDALKKIFPDFNKALKEGKVGAEYLLQIAEAYRKLVSDSLPMATQGLQAQQDRLSNSLFKFKLLIADSGVEKAYLDLLKRFSDFLNSPAGTKFAESIASSLSTAVEVVGWFAERLDSVVTVMATLVAILAGRAFVGAAAMFLGWSEAMTILGLSTATTTRMMGLLKGAFAALALVLIGYDLAKWAWDQSEAFRQYMTVIVVAFHKAFTWVYYRAQILWEDVGDVFQKGVLSIAALVLDGFAASLEALGQADAAKPYRDIAAKMRVGINSIGAESKRLEAELKKQLQFIDDVGLDMFIGVSDAAMKKPPAKKPKAEGTLNPGGSGISPPKPDLSGWIDTKKQLEGEIEDLEAKVLKKEGDSLNARLEAIDKQYQKLLRKIVEFDQTNKTGLANRAQSAILSLQAEEVDKFNAELEKKTVENNKKIAQLENDAGKRSKTDLDTRLRAIEDKWADHLNNLAEQRRVLVENNRDTTTLDNQEEITRALIEQIKQTETLKVYEDQINAVLNERKAKIEVINAQKNAGILSDKEARDQINQVVDEIQPKLDTLTEKTFAFAETLRAALTAKGIDTTFIDEAIAKVTEANNSGKELKVTFESLAKKTAMDAGQQGLTTFFTDLVNGTKSFKSALRDLVVYFAQAMAEMAAKAVAADIMGSIFSNKSGGSAGGGGGGGFWSSVVGFFASLFHEGGVVGAPGNKMRPARPEWFIGAPRYHNGGIPGLSSGEYPAILKKNEEVLTANDPRNILNGGKGAQRTPGGYRIVNVVDPNLVADYLTSSAGEQVILNTISRNPGYVRQILGA